MNWKDRDPTDFLLGVSKTLGNVDMVTRNDVAKICIDNGLDWPHWLTNDAENRVSYGVYSLAKGRARAATLDNSWLAYAGQW